MKVESQSRQVAAVIEELIAAGREIGVQVTAYLNGALALDCAFGVSNVETGAPVTSDTLFNVFSVSKAVSATALHMQVARGHIGYDSHVTEFWPEYGCKGKEATTVRDVLSHRAGVPLMPEGVTPATMVDRDWMMERLAAMTPVAPPGEKALYHSMTFGWLVDKLVEMSDPQGRTVSTFVREEIAGPLDAPDLWIGLPRSEHGRVAKLVDAAKPMDPANLPPLFLGSMPPAVGLVPAVFESEEVRCAALAGVGGVFTSRSCARFWAMLACGGILDGVRLLPEDLVATFNTPRTRYDEPDLVMFGTVLPLSIAGFWLGGNQLPVAAAKYPRAICHPGAGNSIGWADPETGLAVAICHNRMEMPATREEDSALIIADSIRAVLGLE